MLLHLRFRVYRRKIEIDFRILKLCRADLVRISSIITVATGKALAR